MSAPVVFLAFSNDPDAHLDLLKTESKNVYGALSDLDRQEFVKIHREESADVDSLFEVLASFKDRVAIFHYAGHANGTTLRLEGDAAHASGIAGLLGDQPNLKLVFLNGCATRPQVDQLLAAGVKAVIATSVPIRDDQATLFATRFYQALARRRTIEQAFNLARAYLKTRYDDGRALDVVPVPKRDFSRDLPPTADTSMPWGLYVGDEHGRDVLQWTLPYYRTVGLPPEMNDYIRAEFTDSNRYVMRVLDEMARYNPDIYGQMLEPRGGETVKRDSREYPELIIKNFPWPIGSQIRLLRLHTSPGVERLEHLVSAYVRTSQVLYYILLSDLWERSRRGTIDVPRPLDAGLPMDQGAFSSFDFLTKAIDLYRIFQRQQDTPYLVEFALVAAAWDDADGHLQNAHAYLETIRAELAAGVPGGDLAKRCTKAEQALLRVLRAAAFMARYRMLTVRNIVVEAPRFEDVSYEIDMGPLNATDTNSLNLYQDLAHRRKSRYSNSQSIVLARDEEALDDCLNLSPFIVDKNTFVSVKKSDSADKDRLADIFVLSYQEAGRLVYLAVDHGLRYAMENERDRIHTDMTREDFLEGRNITASSSAADFGLDDDFGCEPRADAGDGAKVFRMLRDQLDAFVADLETGR